MTDLTIAHEDQLTGGRYVGRIAGVPGEAELIYTRSSPSRLVAVHTFAPDSMRGSGVALALVERLVTDARAVGAHIAPQCSYVKVQGRRHPEWADVIDDD